jgi:hypothetical protein
VLPNPLRGNLVANRCGRTPSRTAPCVASDGDNESVACPTTLTGIRATDLRKQVAALQIPTRRQGRGAKLIQFKSLDRLRDSFDG